MKTFPVVDIPIETHVREEGRLLMSRGTAMTVVETTSEFLLARIWVNWICLHCKYTFIRTDYAKEHSLLHFKHKVVDREGYKRMVITRIGLRAQSKS